MIYGYKRANVAEQRRDPQSLLNWTERMIRARTECPEISWGNFHVLRTSAPEVLAVKIDCPRDELLVEVFDGHHSKTHNDGAHRIPLDGYAWRWFRVGGPDNAPNRSDLDLTNPRR